MGLFIQFALAAAQFAMEQAQLQITPGHRRPRGCVHRLRHRRVRRDRAGTHGARCKGDPRQISPFFIPAAIVNLASGFVSIRYGAKGPNSATCTACSSSTHAVGDSFKLIQRCAADVMICGGAEAAITPMGVGGFAAMRALSTRNQEPERASRPFDQRARRLRHRRRRGHTHPGRTGPALKRGAPILAEVVGYGMSGDAFPHHRAGGKCRWRRARHAEHPGRLPDVSAEQVQYINAHGTSTPYNDRLETLAIKKVFGEHASKLAVSSTKSMTGHLLGGAGGLEAGITVLALRDQVMPPTINLENPDPDCDLDYVPNQSRKAEVEYALSNSFGFGGTNAALLFKRYRS